MPSKLTAFAVAMGFVWPAYADTHVTVQSSSTEVVPGAFVIGAPTELAIVDHATLAITTTGGEVVARLTIDLSTSVQNWRDVATSLTLPRGTRVHGMALTLGGERSVAEALGTGDALVNYEGRIRYKNDPALLEHVDTTSDVEKLSLRVYPLSKATPATVEIEMVLPAITSLALDTKQRSIAKAEVVIDGKVSSRGELAAARTIEIPFATGTAPTRTTKAVGTHVSLFADGNVEFIGGVRPIVCTFSIGEPVSRIPTPDKMMIRDRVGFAMPRLRQCYMREAQKRPSLAGTVQMHFTIYESGKVGEISVDGALDSDAVKACIASEVATLEFHQHESGNTRVNYPLTFSAK